MQRHIFITGAGSGIGKAAALRFAKNNDKITIAEIDKVQASEVASEIKNLEGKCKIVVGDVSAHKDVLRMFDEAESDFGATEVLINCAGIYPSNPVTDVTEKEWDRIMNINLKGTFFISQRAINSMLKLKKGKIVNIASIDGRTPGPNNSVYSASKAGVISLTRSFAAEFTEHGINVNAVAPGWVGTPNIYKSDRWKEAVKKIPVGRMATAEEIANLIFFLCSEEAEYIAGEVININGGMLMD